MIDRSMTATLKYALSSEKKMSLVARLIRGKQVVEVLTLLNYLPKRAAKILLKVVKSASANAKNNMNISPSTLYVKEVLVSAGPKIKRVRSVGRSRMHGYVKHRAFVKVTLDVNEGQAVATMPVTHAEDAEAPKTKTTKKTTGTKATKPASAAPKASAPVKMAAPKKPTTTAKPTIRKAASRGA